jgi:hypothetical protein
MPTKNQAFLSVKPELQDIAWNIMLQLEALGYEPEVAQGLRTVADEATHVANGTSQTMHSYHILGLAVDIVDKKWGWNIPLHHKFWYDYGKIVCATTSDYGEIQWGGVWALGDERWPLIEKAQQEQSDAPLTWFMDVAHLQLMESN